MGRNRGAGRERKTFGVPATSLSNGGLCLPTRKTRLDEAILRVSYGSSDTLFL